MKHPGLGIALTNSGSMIVDEPGPQVVRKAGFSTASLLKMRVSYVVMVFPPFPSASFFYFVLVFDCLIEPAATDDPCNPCNRWRIFGGKWVKRFIFIRSPAPGGHSSQRAFTCWRIVNHRAMGSWLKLVPICCWPVIAPRTRTLPASHTSGS